MLEVRLSEHRGRANADWLQSHFTFSFAEYFDPAHIGFSDLLVINDDVLKPSRGFATHPHRDMEIMTYVLEGPGDVQLMSAGTGIHHSEFNHSEWDPVHLLQIWIVPNEKRVAPRYQQVHVSQDEKRGALRQIISPNGESGSLSIYQDVKVFAGLFDGNESFSYSLHRNRYAYIHIARGHISVNDLSLKAGDGVKVREEESLLFHQGVNAEVLLFDLSAKEIPDLRR